MLSSFLLWCYQDMSCWFGNTLENFFGNAERGAKQFVWNETHGVGDTHILGAFMAEGNNDMGVPIVHIVDIVEIAHGNVGDVSGIEFYNLAGAVGIEDTDTHLAADEVTTFVSIRMPVGFAQASLVKMDRKDGQALEDRKLLLGYKADGTTLVVNRFHTIFFKAESMSQDTGGVVLVVFIGCAGFGYG